MIFFIDILPQMVERMQRYDKKAGFRATLMK